jgi:hypothetical protein
MEPSSKIFDYLYLGTEWNASNWEELEANNCRFILNVTREIPNFFPEHIQYYNVRYARGRLSALLGSLPILSRVFLRCLPAL